MAADPVVVTCTANTWVKVATSVLTGMIHKLSLSPNVYRMVTRQTGGSAPTNDTGAWLAFGKDIREEISDSAAIDVYIKAVRVDGEVSVVL